MRRLFRLFRLTLTMAAALALQSATAAPLIVGPSIPAAGEKPSPAAEMLARGYKAIESGDLAAAEAALKEAIKVDPSSPGGYVGLAEVAAQRNQTAQVEVWLKKASEVDPNGATTQRVWARWHVRQKRFADAEAILRKLLTARPDAVDIRMDLAEMQFLGAKNPKAAEASYREAIKFSPRHMGAQLGLAAVLIAQGRSDDAVAVLEAASKADPRDPQPLLVLARHRASQAKVDEAVKVLDRLIAANPTSGQAYLDRGDLLLLKNDVPGAIETYNAMVRALPSESATGHQRLASIYEAQQKWPEAEQAYRAAIRVSPEFVPAYNNLAFMLAERREQLPEARKLIDRAMRLAPKEAAVLDTLAWVQRAQGDLDAAAKTLRQALAAQPRNPMYHYHLGIVLAEQGRAREAETSLKQALSIDGKFKRADDARERLQKLGGKG